jgi:lysophospholipase L1-like esterase
MINGNNRRKINKEQKGKRKILLIGDSHMKGLSSELKQNLGDTCEILGIVKPNASVTELVGTSIQEVNKLAKNDVLVFWGGANDVSKNNSSKGLIQEINYLRTNQQTNNIVITVPHRFDLDYNSCVNTEVKKYNRRLVNVTKNLNKVTLIKAEMERRYYTRHGLHLNMSGKEIMANKLITVIQETIGMQTKKDIIPMPWKNTLQEHSRQESQDKSTSNITLNENTYLHNGKERNREDPMRSKENHANNPGQELEYCNRRKRRPPTRNEDFLWL